MGVVSSDEITDLILHVSELLDPVAPGPLVTVTREDDRVRVLVQFDFADTPDALRRLRETNARMRAVMHPKLITASSSMEELNAHIARVKAEITAAERERP